MKIYLLIGLVFPLLVSAISPQALKHKIEIRQHIMKNGRVRVKSSPSYNDDVQDLFPEFRIERNLLALPEMGSTKVAPWSDDYWPIYKGMLGARYINEDFQEVYSWKEAKDFVTQNPVKVDSSVEEIDNLSPSEKFDLLITKDVNSLKLTQAMWAQGEQYLAQYDEVEKWMGICHGWAPASFKVSRPKNAVTVKDAQGRDIKFYPSDIKALSSLLWATGDYQNHFVGGRCSQKEPEEDENGRVTAKDCIDNNPATFHLALANGIGIHKESFVMDATYDYEVWNQPISSFGVVFFNPNKGDNVENIKEGIIALSDYAEDPYKKYRSKKAKYIVGVQLELNYIVEIEPTHRLIDNVDFDGINRAYYVYDLELDENYNIVGGEWYDNQHPDFLWRPDADAQALTYYDYYLMSDPLWDGKAPLNLQYKELANKAAMEGSPLAFIVRSLVELSQKK